MTLQSFKDQYLITDSELVGVHVDYANTSLASSDKVTLLFKGRKITTPNRWVIVPFSLEFQPAVDFQFNEDFRSRAISQSTLVKLDSEHFYLSLDPSEEGHPSIEDNMLVKSTGLHFMDEKGVKQKLT